MKVVQYCGDECTVSRCQIPYSSYRGSPGDPQEVCAALKLAAFDLEKSLFIAD